MEPICPLPCSQEPVIGPYPEPEAIAKESVQFRGRVSFYDEKLLAPRPTPTLEDHPLSGLRDRLFTIAFMSVGCILHQPWWQEPR
jgi:hypothetical protein